MPPPHQAQAHFYGAPEIDFGRARAKPDNMSSAEIRCSVLDSLASAGDEGQRAVRDVLLVGNPHRLDVYSIGKSKPCRIGCLESLRGAVVGAKVLPAPPRNDSLHSLRPLVALVVHGVCEPPGLEAESRPGTSHSERSEFDPSGSMLHALHETGPGTAGSPTYFQTTVDVYSLKTRKHLATLLRGPKVKAELSLDYRSSITIPPEQVMSVQASSRYIVVGLAASGELFIFDGGSDGSDGTWVAFRCLGKVWTRISQKRSRSLSVSSDSSEAERSPSASPGRSNRPDAPIFSLNHRWLAVVPPLASSQKTIHAIVGRERSSHTVPGLTSHTVPSEPPVTCESDTPEAESLLNKVARDVTQEFMKGARWVGDQGMQAWHNYWSKSPDRNAAPPSSSYPNRPSSMTIGHSSFPPTHANDVLSNRKSSQPTCVSLLDLEKLGEGQRLKPDKALQPIATFAVLNGCSFLSFAPSGLHLLTTSTKGDVQQVWSLLRMVNGEAGQGMARNADGRAPFVREIKRFTRMTEASIVDVVWALPKGEKLAIVTDKKTVHIYDMPLTSFQWPPPRRNPRPITIGAATTKPSSGEELPNTSIHTERPENRFGAAFNVVTGRTQPLFAAVRGRPMSAGSALSGWRGLVLPTGAGVTGGKAMSAGLNKSIGAAAGTVNSLRHLGENRLSVPASLNVLARGCVTWLGGRNEGFIAAVGGDVIRIHSVTPSTNPKAGKRRSSVHASKPSEFSIPTSTENFGKPFASSTVAIKDEQSVQSTPPKGFWQLPPQTSQPHSRKQAPHPLSCAEIETNAPYQPFHTDRRIGFSLLGDDNGNTVTGESSHGSCPWVFGELIPATQISIGSATIDDEPEEGQNRLQPLENLVSVAGKEEGGQQFVVTTRRKRAKERTVGEEMEEDFFEDDCEVVDFAEDRV